MPSGKYKCYHRIVDERTAKAGELEQKVDMLEVECSTLHQELQDMEARVKRGQKKSPEEANQVIQVKLYWLPFQINQKMMESAMIKDLYSGIDWLKQEVYAAREKNGIYIPRDRYLQEVDEKKAMAEKIEPMELESESKDKS